MKTVPHLRPLPKILAPSSPSQPPSTIAKLQQYFLNWLQSTTPVHPSAGGKKRSLNLSTTGAEEKKKKKKITNKTKTIESKRYDLVSLVACAAALDCGESGMGAREGHWETREERRISVGTTCAEYRWENPSQQSSSSSTHRLQTTSYEETEGRKKTKGRSAERTSLCV